MNLLEALVTLNCVLTGKKEDAVRLLHANTIASWPKTAEEWFFRGDNQIYLTDGGYSRVYFSEAALIDGEEDILRLDSVSRQEVKAVWNLPEAARIRASISEYLRGEYKRLED